MTDYKLVPVEPTDDELLAWAGEEQFFLFCDKDDFLQIARAVMQRYAGRSPDVQARPFHDLDPNWLYSVIRYARKAGFYPDVTEGLREMNENEAFLVPNLYADHSDQGVGVRKERDTYDM